MSAAPLRTAGSDVRKLQTLLGLLIIWNLLALLTELTFGGFLAHADGDRIDGVFGARMGFSGSALALAALYLYALVRGPVRHRNVFWVAIIEQGAAAFFAVYHFGVDDITVTAMVVPLVVACALLLLLFVNMPRGQVAP
jgi:hypothetical protein